MEGLQDGDAATERIDPLLEESTASSDSGSSTGSDQQTSQLESWLNKQARNMRKTWDRLTNSIDQRSFSLLRKICMQRFEAHAMDSNVRSFSYVNIASQVGTLLALHECMPFATWTRTVTALVVNSTSSRSLYLNKQVLSRATRDSGHDSLYSCKPRN
jgi:hypothetical protein